MIKAKARKPWQDGLICDDCGREWVEVLREPDGPDDRGFVSLRGGVGDTLFQKTLCPQCVDDMIDILANSVDRLAIVRSNRAYVRERAEEILSGFLPLAEPDAPIPLTLRRKQREQFA